jgi:hypothetical protein
MANFTDVLKQIGKAFASLGKYLAKFVTDAQIDIAIDVVRDAADRFIENADRREWAVKELQGRVHVPEAVARWLVETAVIAVKAQVAEALEKAGDELKKVNDPKDVPPTV